jgi:DNA invertase Pin-like site-specific DNA recombinase
MRDMVQKGRSTGQRYPQKNYANLTRVPMPGEKNHQAKLTASDVRAIRAASGTRAVLAARFGVSRSTIKRIRTWNGWLHLGPRPADRQTEAGQ